MNFVGKRILLSALLALSAPAALSASVEATGSAVTAGQRDEARSQQPENYCLGGIEDRKIIVDESQLSNPFRETSRLGCEVDGGDPHTMPDLPTPTAELQRLA